MYNKAEHLRLMGERMREYRTRLQYTQEHAAELLDMSLTYYGKIERGQGGMSLEKIMLAHKKMEVDPTYLLTGERQPEINVKELLENCPRDKRYEMEQIIKYVLELALK